MTGIVEHKSLRYNWELVRHSYLVDVGNEIGIQQVEISPPDTYHLLDPPYPVTRFFEIEIDQIQKNGRTVFSFRNICPVQIDQRPELPLLSHRIGKESWNITKRLHAQEGETETRWLYTSDFFLLSVSSGDRHDLGTLLSLILGRLNMIALSVLSGKRIRSEVENQLEYRNSIGTLFSNGVDGAFRDVPVYKQHGEVTSSGPDANASAQNTQAGKSCSICGAAISSTAKFCGNCGTAVNTTLLSAIAPESSGIPAVNDGETTVPFDSKTPAKLVVDLKSEELGDLSWLYE